MRLNLALLALLVFGLCGSVIAESGPAIGEEAVAFDPYHVTGPHAGKTACPLCVYGMRPGVQIWATADGLADATRIGGWLESRLKRLGADHFKVYILYVPATEDRAAAAQTVNEKTAAAPPDVWRLLVPGPDDADSTGAYKIDPAAKTTVLVYVNRRVAAKFVDLGATDADRDRLLAAVDDAAPREEPAPGSPPVPVALCGPEEPGRKLHLWGRVWDEDGRPLSKAAVIAYNAGEDGLYNPPGAGTRTPRIRGTAVTDARGFYSFTTVWPGAYPNATDPAHIHLGAVAASHHLKYLLVLFKDDPMITPENSRGIDGEVVVIVEPQKQDDGAFVLRQDIRLEGN